uniref:spore cortex-lytic protein n=1 Tax=Candidatus Fimenecus sp. TaxID=3022888 RepID=UPI003FEF7205
MRDNALRVCSPGTETGAKKMSGSPSQPGRRSTASSSPIRKKKHRTILQRIFQFFKRLNRKGRAAVALLVLAFLFFIWKAFAGVGEPHPPEIVTIEPPVVTTETAAPEYIFRDGDGYPVNWQALTAAWAAEAGFEKRYDLTDAERWEVASVVTGEAGGEPFAGQVAVAQCILQTCEDDGLRPSDVLEKYSYTKRRPDPTDEALEAVQAVFDFGHVASTEPIKYFYAPALTDSEWHESQLYVMAINGHRFFKEATK